MASGKQIGEFSFKFITITCSPGPGGSVLNQTTWEGKATGFGTVFTTVTYVGGPKSGTFSECGTAFLDNGDGLSGIGQGTYESIGANKWRTAGFMQLSDGRRHSSEGEINLAERSYKGRLFEMS
jgi:hypothetical protein